MRNMSRALVFVLVIIAISAGVYVLMEEGNDGALENAGEEIDRAIDDIGDEIDR